MNIEFVGRLSDTGARRLSDPIVALNLSRNLAPVHHHFLRNLGDQLRGLLDDRQTLGLISIEDAGFCPALENRCNHP